MGSDASSEPGARGHTGDAADRTPISSDFPPLERMEAGAGDNQHPQFNSAPVEVPAREDQQPNNIGLLRLLFASLVLVSHCFYLTNGSNSNEPLYVRTHFMSMGSLAVDGFFLISGYLIALSWMRNPDAGAFVKKRIARIYPGYLVAFGFSAIAGWWGSGSNGISYCKALFDLNDRLPLALLFLDFGILNRPQAFLINPVQVVNGSLWTLEPELWCYWLVLVLGLFQLLSRASLLVVLCAVSYFMFVLSGILFRNTELTMWRFFTFFFAGAVVANCDRARLINALRNPLLVLAAGGVLAAASKSHLLLLVIFPFLGAYLVFAVAFAGRTIGSAFFKRHDLSYGIYLYAFPVQQLCIYQFGLRAPLQVFVYAFPATLVLAWISWRLIEAPFLRRKPGQSVDFSSTVAIGSTERNLAAV